MITLDTFYRKLSQVKSPSAQVPTSSEQAGFRRAQRLAYQCAEEIGRELRPGWSEKRTARLMDEYLRDHGVKSFFHRSFAWFGDRTRFQNFKHYWTFMPSSRELQETDVIILDTAPIVDQYAGDIGYTFSLQPHSGLKDAQDLLAEFRQVLPEWFSSDATPGEIWKKVDDRIRERGYDNCHALYPFAVLGHRLHRIPWARLPGVTVPFSLHSYWALLKRGLFPELLSREHTGEKIGIWAIEPHLGGAGFGAKFEEILVVEPGRAYWLDEEVPHARARGTT